MPGCELKVQGGGKFKKGPKFKKNKSNKKAKKIQKKKMSKKQKKKISEECECPKCECDPCVCPESGRKSARRGRKSVRRGRKSVRRGRKSSKRKSVRRGRKSVRRGRKRTRRMRGGIRTGTVAQLCKIYNLSEEIVRDIMKANPETPGPNKAGDAVSTTPTGLLMLNKLLRKRNGTWTEKMEATHQQILQKYKG